MNNLENNNGLLEGLEQRVRNLLLESKDRYFTEYLQKMTERVRQQKYQTNLLADELDRSYQMYLKRMNLATVDVEETPESMEVQETTEIPENVQAQEMPYFSFVDETPRQQPTTYQNVVTATPVVQKSKSTEFAIGTAVLSVVGGGFILAALVMLGMTYMEGFVKGIGLYGVALLFLLVSELLLYRKLPKLGATFSAIGIGGLYLSTVVNYLGLHNFNLWVTLGVTLGITLFVVLLSRKRDSVLYRIIGLIAGYLCFFTVTKGITDTEFIVVSGMILLLNILCILLPVKRAGTGIRIAHMYVNTFLAFSFMLSAMDYSSLSELPIVFFVISSLVVLVLLYVVECYSYRKEQNVTASTGILVSYYIGLVLYALMMLGSVSEVVDIYANNWYCYSSAMVVGAIGLIAFLVLSVGRCSGKWHIYSSMNIMICMLLAATDNDWALIICVLTILVLAKLLSWKRNTVVQVNDIIITTMVCIMTVCRDGADAYALLAGVIFSILMIHYWQTAYEIILTATILIYTVSHLPIILHLPAVVGILLVGILAFNNVKRWRGKYILLFNGLALAVQIICFVRLSSPVYQNEYLTYICMLVFGLATIGLTLQEKYQMSFKSKYMVLAVFLTYMVFIFKTDIPVISSVLLMVIALVSVGIGFAVNRKSVRIYGLVLSLVVCGKLVFFDFFQAATLQKTILFFAVGVIALVIAAIYIILEKKNNVS